MWLWWSFQNQMYLNAAVFNFQQNFAYSSSNWSLNINCQMPRILEIFFWNVGTPLAKFWVGSWERQRPLSDIRLNSIKKLENGEAFSKWPERVDSLMKLWTNTHTQLAAGRGAILLLHDWQRHKPGAGADKLWIFTQFNGYQEKDIGWLYRVPGTN